ncbi:P-loop containing nucleoside triphosphate hydrolase protein [Spinellus fusiger]|nr:P-loop containing nucleoside triphosphate hydrolase protein [Spinellus fusiger]
MNSELISESFFSQLNILNVSLDTDILDYVKNILDNMQHCDNEEIRESTETFLIDAAMDTVQINAFYTELFKSLFNVLKKDENKLIELPKKNRALVGIENKTLDSISRSLSLLEIQDDSTTNPTVCTSRRTKKSQEKIKNHNPSKNCVIVATCQQSRFHTEARTTSVTKEIDLQVNISIDQLELLSDAHLKIKPSIRYGLIGQNGVGKTTLMKCLAEDILTGIPQNLNILHIEQLQVFDEEQTILSEVLSANKESATALRDMHALQKALSGESLISGLNKKPNEDLRRAVHNIMLYCTRKKVESAAKMATRRSGARGREARQKLLMLENEYKELAAKDPISYIDAQMSNDIMKQVFEKSKHIDVDAQCVKAHSILRRIGFTKDDIDSPVVLFSGGWRMKIALAKALFIEPDILLLDEPTNHLDLSAILWLKDYLINKTWDMSMVIVSHDREFLNAVCDETIIFKDKKLLYHPGNFDSWERNTEEQRLRKQALLNANEKRRKNILTSIQINMQRAKATGDDKRHGMVNSRRKKLDQLGMEKTEDGKRFKVSYRAGYFSDSREQIVVDQAVKTAKIKVPHPQPLRYHGPVLSLNSVSFHYPKEKKSIISNFSISVGPNSRIAFLGSNGSGKTTLLNILTENLRPSSGEVYVHPSLRIGYFSQHLVNNLDLESTPIEEMKRRHPSMTEQDCRAQFGTVGVNGNTVLLKIKYLSGGQRNRIMLSIILQNEPHVLVMDEITNHLDMGTAELLVEILSEYSGALIVVSHDIWFLRQLLETTQEDSDKEDKISMNDKSEIYIVKNGQVSPWKRSIDDYVSLVFKTQTKN